MSIADGREADREAWAVFGPDGKLARVMPGFEYRPQQVEMAACVWRAFAGGRTALIEAGTGTGKSLAYLYPGLVHARRAGQPLVVSTATINLQEQLLKKDLPTLGLLGDPPKTVLLVGRRNYLCRRRLELALTRGVREIEDELATALSRAARTGLGERNRLGFTVPDDAWALVSSEAEYCLRQRCPWASGCYWQAAKRAAAEAEILLVNHHLLLADVSIRRARGWEADYAVLPAYTRVVFDEAHHLEDIATEYFSTRLSSLGLARLLDRLARQDGPSVLSVVGSGLLPAGVSPTPERMQDTRQLALDALGQANRLRFKAEEFFAVLVRLTREQGRQESGSWQRRYQEDLRAIAPELGPLAEDLGVLLGGLAKALDKLLELWEGPNAEAPASEEGLAMRAAKLNLLDLAAGLEPILGGGSRAHVYWLECARYRGVDEVEAIMAPLLVGPDFHAALLSNLDGAIFSSATLTAGGEFAFFRERLGLDLVHPGERIEIQLDAPFDYRRQVLLAAPTDIPEPDAPDFPDRAALFLAELLRAAQGRTLILFTSFGALDRTCERLQPLLSSNLRLLRQGERPRADLLAEFQRDDGAVLCGTDSFWEGVDVPGLALSCVVLMRLPFRVPTEPIAEARTEQIAREGGSPFQRYSLPQAVIKLKQGFGRLVRRGDDTGAVVVLDRRLLTKPYGQVFRQALPRCTECFGPAETVLRAVGEWLGKGTGEGRASRVASHES
ncbi:MAG: ATP-dependent DNA helicase [Bacteroidota bacterium]